MVKRQPILQGYGLLAAILVAAVAVRAGACLWWESRLPDGSAFAFGDSESYWTLAKAIAHGQPYLYGDAAVFRTPGYPAVLAPLFWLAENPPVLWARLLGAALGTLTVGLMFVWVDAAIDRPTALVAAAMCAFYPGAVAMSTFVLSEALFCPLMLLNLMAWTATCKVGSVDHRADEASNGGLYRLIAFAAMTGISAAAAILTRPSWLLFPFFLVIAGAFVQRPMRRNLLACGVMLTAIAVCMSPWWIRNYQVTGTFVPTTLQVGASLYDGLHAGADGSSEMSFVAREKEELVQELDSSGANPSAAEIEVALNNRLRGKAVAWAKENPGSVLQLAGVKLVRIWNVWPNSAEFQSLPMRLVILAGYLPLLALAFVGGWVCRNRTFTVIAVLPAVYFTLLHCVFVSSIRYRQPAMLVLIGLSAVGLVAVWRWVRER